MCFEYYLKPLFLYFYKGKYGELGQGSVITKKKPSLMAELNGITFRCVKVSNGYSAAISGLTMKYFIPSIFVKIQY
jgi:hypothetical protein